MTTRLRAACSHRKVLALTVHEARAYMWQFRQAGTSGYVLKRAPAVELVRAIWTVAAGGTYLDPAMASEAFDALTAPPPALNDASVELSEREAEVVRQLALGYSNRQIAAALQVSVKTVETYKGRSMEKLGIRSRVGLVRYAARRGWLTPRDATRN